MVAELAPQHPKKIRPGRDEKIRPGRDEKIRPGRDGEAERMAKEADRQQEGGAAVEGRSGDWGEVVTR